MTCTNRKIRPALTVTAALALATIPLTEARSASMRVTMACANDYFAYCSRHDPDGPQVRACFRANGSKLSKQCVNALVAAGEVSKAEVTRRSASNR